MDESKPPFPASEFHFSAPERTPADIHSGAPDLVKSKDPVAAELRNGSGPYRNDPSDGPSIAVYYRNEEEVREGFLIALRAMGVVAEQPPEPVMPAVRGAKP